MSLVKYPKHRSRARGSLLATALAVASFLAVASPASADVFMERADCGVGAGEVPGLPGLPPFDLTSEGLALGTPSGVVTIRCHGQLPEGIALDRTFQGDVFCAIDVPGYEPTAGHLVITRSGRATLFCRLAPSP